MEDIFASRHLNPEWPESDRIFCWDVIDASSRAVLIVHALGIGSNWTQGVQLELLGRGRLTAEGRPQESVVDLWFDHEGVETQVQVVDAEMPIRIRIQNGWIQDEYGVSVEDFAGTDMSGMKIEEITPSKRIYHCNGPGGRDFSVFEFSLEWLEHIAD